MRRLARRLGPICITFVAICTANDYAVWASMRIKKLEWTPPASAQIRDKRLEVAFPLLHLTWLTSARDRDEIYD
jgi:hypothetical protein